MTWVDMRRALGPVGRALWGADPPRRCAPLERRVPPYLAAVMAIAITANLFWGAAETMSGTVGVPLNAAWALAAFQVLPVLAAPWFPLMAWRVSLVGMVLGTLATVLSGHDTWPWPAASCVAYLAGVLIIALRHDRAVAGGVAAVTAVALPLPAIFAVGMSPLFAVIAATVTGGVAAAGAAVRPRIGSGERPPVADPPDPEPPRTGPAAVPVLGPVIDALWGASDARRGIRVRLPRPLAVVLGIVWLCVSGGLFGGAVGQMYGPTQMGFTLAMAYGLGTLQALPLVAAPWFPVMCWRLSAIGMVLGALASPVDRVLGGPYPATAAGQWPWPVTSCIVFLVICFLVALRHDRRVTEGVGLLTLAVGVPLLALRDDASLPALLLTVAFTLIVLVLGDNIRARRTAQTRLAEQAALRRRDLARQAVLEERSRIARELHDVVAHHMSMIAIQAEAAPYKIPGLPEEALRTFTTIRGASTTALTEMRRLIGLLRDEDAAAERLPQPGLDMLDDLVGGAREAGMTVRTRVDGVPAPLPAGVDVSAYRIVQEALSNAGRHAPGAAVTITIGYETRLLRIRVADDGAVTGSPDTTPAGGHGLVGMRERVTMLGGAFTAGRHDDGGFVVSAELPIDDTTTDTTTDTGDDDRS